MKKKLKIHTFPIDHLFESKEDMELYRKIHFPNLANQTTTSSSAPATLWIDEAVAYLGLDRIGLKEPTKAIHRLINKGALHPRKIGGRLVFDRVELEKVFVGQWGPQEGEREAEGEVGFNVHLRTSILLG